VEILPAGFRPILFDLGGMLAYVSVTPMFEI
jgi:hypothetical protein